MTTKYKPPSNDEAQAKKTAPVPHQQPEAPQTVPEAGMLSNLPTITERRANILALQRTVGNRKVQRMLQRRGAAAAPAQRSSVVARKPADVAEAKRAAEAAKAAADLAVAARTRAENTAKTLEQLNTELNTAETKQAEADREATAFEAALKRDNGASGWKQMATTAKQRAESAVIKIRSLHETLDTAQKELKKGQDAAKKVASTKKQAATALSNFQKFLTEIKSSEQSVYSAATVTLAREAANTASEKAKTVNVAYGGFGKGLTTMEGNVKTAGDVVNTLGTTMPGSSMLSDARSAYETASADLALVRDMKAIIDLIIPQTSQSADRASRVATAKEQAEQKALAAQEADTDAKKKGEAQKEAEKAAKEFADIAKEAQGEADRLGEIKSKADALAQKEAEAYTAAEAKAKEYRALADNAVGAEDYVTRGYNDAADDAISGATTKRADARRAADEATAPKTEADLRAGEAKKQADESGTKSGVAKDDASKAATRATNLDLEAQTAASDRDAAQLTAQTDATADDATYAQQGRLRTLAGTQTRVNELANTVGDATKLEDLLTRFGYEKLNRYLGMVGGLPNLETLMAKITNVAQLSTLLDKLGYAMLDTLVKIPLTLTQITDLTTRVPYVLQLERLMTALGYTLLDKLIKMTDATPDIVEGVWDKVKNKAKTETLADAIAIKSLGLLLANGATVDTLHGFATGQGDATKRATVIDACSGNGTLLTDLLTKTNDNGEKLSKWLSPAGGHKAAALNSYLNDGERSADTTMIWDSSQTVGLAAVPITSPPGPAKTLVQIMAAAVPMNPPGSIPPHNGYAGNRPWGTSVNPGDAVLPQYTAAGAAITYTEYDIHPYTGANRGADRVVVGNDGRKYLTTDHYKHFKLIS